VLPGILGSHLKAGDKRIWLGLRPDRRPGRLRYQAEGADGVQPDGAIGMVYDDLIDAPGGRAHEVIEFDFDWRRPIEEEARRLADAVEPALDAREPAASRCACSPTMGGVVARTMQLERPQTFGTG
jgi:hypothetical protein